MRWDSVDPRRYLTDQARLFVRNHTVDAGRSTRSTWRLRVFGDGLATPRSAAEALVADAGSDLRRLPRDDGRVGPRVHRQRPQLLRHPAGHGGRRHGLDPRRRRDRACGRASGCATCSRRSDLSGRGVDPGDRARPEYVTGGVDYGSVRRPFPVSKALDDAILAWGANGADLLPDHGYPVRLVLPGWVGIGSASSGSGRSRSSRTELTSPWNTKWYRMTGGDLPGGLAAPDRQPGALGVGAAAAAPRSRPAGRSRSPAAPGAAPAPIRRVEVSLDGGSDLAACGPATTSDRHGATTTPPCAATAGRSGRWSGSGPRPGSYELLARATDGAGPAASRS